MDLVLVYFKDDGGRRDIRIKGGRCVIGRGEGCDVQAPLPTISRTHCEIRTTPDGGVFVRDLGSSNGTFINGERIEREAGLAAGDHLALGKVTFAVQINGEPAHVEPPLLDPPTGPPPGARAPTSVLNTSRAQSASAPPSRPDPDDSEADIADLLSRASGADDSSVFEFDIDLDEDKN